MSIDSHPPGLLFLGGWLVALLLGCNYFLAMTFSSLDASFRELWRLVGVAEFIALGGTLMYMKAPTSA